MWRSAAERHCIYESAAIPELAHRSQPVSRDDRDVFPLQYGKKETARLLPRRFLFARGEGGINHKGDKDLGNTGIISPGSCRRLPASWNR